MSGEQALAFFTALPCGLSGGNFEGAKPSGHNKWTGVGGRS